MRHHEDWLKAYMRYSRFSESPDKYHLFCAISTIAGALRRKVWIDQGDFQWTPNFFIFLIGPPGVVQKSTSIDIGYDLLKELPGVYVAPQSGTWQELVQRMSKHSDTVILSGGETFTHSSLTGAIRELGTFLKMDDTAAINALVSLWDGKMGGWDHATKGKGSDIIYNPWINLIGGATDSWVRENLDHYFIGGGMASRSLFIYANKKRHLTALPAKARREAGFDRNDARIKLLEDLATISELKGDFYLTEPAELWMEQWYTALNSEETVKRYQQMRLGDYFARRQTHLSKLAIILSAAQSDSKQVTEVHLQTAEIILNEAEADMAYLFGLVGMADDAKHVQAILTLCQGAGTISKATLWRCLMNQIGDYGRFEKALLSASRAGYIFLNAHLDDVLIVYNGGKK